MHHGARSRENFNSAALLRSPGVQTAEEHASERQASESAEQLARIFCARSRGPGDSCVIARAEDIEAWLVRQLAERLDTSSESIDPCEPFASYGLTSREAVVLSGELEEWLERTLSPTLVWDHPTIRELARFLAGDTAPSQPAPRDTAADRMVAEPIAIVGLGCRFPGAPDPDAFWSLLRSGGDAIREVPADRWDAGAYYDPDPTAAGRTVTRFGGFLPRVDEFEPSFFCISPREASHMDPQQRLLLEVAWEALENAGIAPPSLYGTDTGVFVGISTSDYTGLQLADPERVGAHDGTGSAHSIAANRLSYLLDLRGPSMAVDTACSSSLVAVHLACQSLRTGECRVALAAGVNVMLTPQLTIVFSKAGMMAADGRCKTFDAAADGYVRGEGCGVVILKRLADAVADGDQVLAVVRGSAVNQDGLSNGLTAPSGLAQEAVIRRALARAGVSPHDISYIEAHGTGTPLGDPIEVGALSAVLMPERPHDRPCALASVKTNIGHLEAGAGIAGLIKTVLALVHREIPPHLHLCALNPKIHLEGTSFVIPREALPWQSPWGPRRAGVSAFGFGGTNVHVIVEEAPPVAPRAAEALDQGPQLLALSAQSETALRALAGRYAQRLQALPAADLGDACATARRGRYPFIHRLAVVGESGSQLQARLAAFCEGGEPAQVVCGRVRHKTPPRVAFLFSGQGSQYAGMGRRLYETEPVFRRALDRCEAVLRPRLDVPLFAVLWPEPGAPRLLDETAYTQPALFALQVALTELWRSLGVTPSAVIGHSVGEFAAACAAGVLDVEAAAAVVATRGRLMQALPRGGGMAAVFAPEDVVAAALAAAPGLLSIAAVNGPADVVVSGPAAELDDLVQVLAAGGVKARRLVVSHAFHSCLMEPMLDAFAAAVSEVELAAPNIPLISNVTGEVAAGAAIARAEYWRRHVRAPVRFSAGIQALEALGCEAFVEIGPGATLIGLGQRCIPGDAELWTASLRKGQCERTQLLTAVGALFTRGVQLDFAALDGGRPRRSVALPTYPFERQRCWLEVGGTVAPPRREIESAVLDGRSLGDSLYQVAWRAADRPAPDRAKPPGHWIILPDDGSVGMALRSELEARGATCEVLDAASLDDVARAATGARGVVYLRALDARIPEDPALAGARALAGAQQLSCCGAQQLVHALIAAGTVCPTWLATCRSQAVLPGDAIEVGQAPLWGFGRTLALEHPELWGGLIDLDHEPSRALAAALADELVGEAGEDQIAYRAGRRHVARLERRPDASPRPGSIRGDAVYLVTGGLGGIGLALSRWLVERGARHLVLTGRTANAATSAQRSCIAELERRGAAVRLAQVDASDEPGMAALLADLLRGAPPLRGVFHAAGVSSPRTIAELDASTLAAVLAPKIAGSWILHQLTRDLELDHFVCFSSISSVLGSRRLAGYAAGNAFLDALTHHRAALGLPALSVNWGPWAEVGMTSPAEQAAMERIGLHALPTREALALLDRALGGDAPQVMAAHIDWSAFAPALEARAPRPLLDAVRVRAADTPAEEPELRRRLAATAPEARLALLVDWLRGEVARVLGRDTAASIDVEQGLFEMGLDSLMAVELKRRLERATGLTLPRTIAFEFPDVEALARHLCTVCICPTPSTPSTAATPPAPPALSEREAEALLLDELRSLEQEIRV
ncbi:MAG TPA: SDR family NAD(P)-dependent oxidoreductase [Kofleriaceae bacterium]|nr:SDR family NAD(P)-dependent oxidoreductase [Kofleriaceae bacterium]